MGKKMDNLHWFLDGALIHDKDKNTSFLNMKADEFERKLRELIKNMEKKDELS